LAHTDPPLEDAIELYNPTAAAVEVSGWWLSNDPDAPYKFRIPAGTTIPAGRYMVFYEQNQLNGFSSVAGFNRSGTGVAPDFTFNSAHGDSAVLNQALANGALTGVRVTKGFGPSANGVSFGRYVKSDGGVDYVAMAARTFGTDTPFSVTQFRAGTGLSNSYPLVGPLIISEVYYQPPPVISAGVTNDNSSDEFIELTSLSSAPLALYDPVFPTNCWRLRGGIDYEFPKNTIVPANARILVVNFSPKNDQAQLASFRTKYGVPSDVALFGPYNGKLSNSGDTVQLEKPDPVQLPPHPDAGFVPFVLVDKVKYDVGNGWPTNASGTGCSIQRINLAGYGNDQINWSGVAPTAGRANTAAAVTLLRPTVDSSGLVFSFVSELARTYKVEFATALGQVTWQTLTNLTGTGTPLAVRDPGLRTSARFYRVTAQ
ncbi:MAG TPA: lamin tail domain-containing protein, partial [Bacillota bacterium]|nr:lamin tail domain-containing protein [Bacillota bacterium]